LFPEGLAVMKIRWLTTVFSLGLPSGWTARRQHRTKARWPSTAPALGLLSLSFLAAGGSAQAQINFGLAVPGLSIGIDVPRFPRLVRVPGYPVYYDDQAAANYFFYDGLYWVLRDDRWYQSSWYDGPWLYTANDDVPLFVLRVPVRYYRQPPPYFQGWAANAAPRWGEHWGPDWQSAHRNWNQWDRRSQPAVAPLPSYQRRYSGERYPRAPEDQSALHGQNYRYRGNDGVPAQSLDPRPPQHPAQGPAPQAAPQAPQQPARQPGQRPDQAQPPPRVQQPREPERQRPQPGPDRGGEARPQQAPERGPGDRGREGQARPPDRDNRDNR
jgi:hypothetical protein